MLKPHLKKTNSHPLTSYVIANFSIVKPETSMTRMTQRSMRNAVTLLNYHTNNHKLLRAMLMVNNWQIFPKISSSFLVGTHDPGRAW